MQVCSPMRTGIPGHLRLFAAKMVRLNGLTDVRSPTELLDAFLQSLLLAAAAKNVVGLTVVFSQHFADCTTGRSAPRGIPAWLEQAKPRDCFKAIKSLELFAVPGAQPPLSLVRATVASFRHITALKMTNVRHLMCGAVLELGASCPSLSTVELNYCCVFDENESRQQIKYEARASASLRCVACAGF